MRNYWKNIKTNWTKIENLQNIELNASALYDDRCIQTKIGKFVDKLSWLEYARRCANIRRQILLASIFRKLYS